MVTLQCSLSFSFGLKKSWEASAVSHKGSSLLNKLPYQGDPYPVNFLYVPERSQNIIALMKDLTLLKEVQPLTFFSISELMSVTIVVIPSPLRIIHSQTEQELSGKHLLQFPAIIHNSCNWKLPFSNLFCCKTEPLSSTFYQLSMHLCSASLFLNLFLETKSKVPPYFMVTTSYKPR